MERYLFQFINGPIPETMVMQLIKDTHDTKTGAQSLFIGRIRADKINNITIAAIKYSAYEEMALREADKIMLQLQKKFSLHYLIIYHSLKLVKVNEIPVVILAGATRRSQAIAACNDAINLIKERIPIWGEEISEKGYSQWKTNTKETPHKSSNSLQ